MPYDLSSLRQQVIDTSYRRSSQDTYSPTTPSVGIHTPDSPSGPIPSSTTQSNLPASQNMANSGLFDLSAMMFPSTDPFAYPTQPMTTLENHQLGKQEYPYNSNMYDQASSSTSGPPFDGLDAQLFGPMPSFLMQGHTLGNEIQNMTMPLDMPGGTSTSAMNSGESQWAQQQGGQGVVTPGVNFDQIFGEDWSAGWMDQGYRQ